MVDSNRCESPLIQIDLREFEKASSIRLREIGFQGHLNLRGCADNPAFLDGVTQVLGVEPPQTVNTFVHAGKMRVYWLGPDEWLIVTPPGQQQALQASLDQVLQGVFAAVTDISSGQTILSISGANARALISKGCPLDLHPRVFQSGECAQTRMAKAGVLISLEDDAPSFHLLVRRSFSDYLGIWLLDAAREFFD